MVPNARGLGHQEANLQPVKAAQEEGPFHNQNLRAEERYRFPQKVRKVIQENVLL
jgi:hypothetical protein